MRRFFLPLVAVMALLVFTTRGNAQTVSNPRLYELRIYTATPGRLPDLQTLMATQGVPLLAKHGIMNVFDGTVSEGAPVDGPDAANMLICILSHENRAAADKAWASLDTDEEWKSAWTKVGTAGPLLAKPASSLFMNPVDFSPALESRVNAGAASRIFELRKYNTGPAALQTTVSEFQEGLAAILVKVGMTPVIYWTAADHNSFVYLVAHNDREAARTSWAAFRPLFRPFLEEFNARQAITAASTVSGAPVQATTPRTPDDNRFLVPTTFSPLR